MAEVTRLLEEVAGGDPRAADRLLPLVYTELRRLARARLHHEPGGHTLQATDLVHEAYLRLVRPNPIGGDSGGAPDVDRPGGRRCDGNRCDSDRSGDGPSDRGRAAEYWSGRGHFFAAASEAMRRILVEAARRRNSQKAGGRLKRTSLSEVDPAARSHEVAAPDLLALDDALRRFAAVDPQAAKVVEMRYFAGLTVDETAAALGISARTVKRNWSYAKVWLRKMM